MLWDFSGYVILLVVGNIIVYLEFFIIFCKKRILDELDFVFYLFI